MRSESTRAFGQPRLTKPTFGFCRDMGRMADEKRGGGLYRPDPPASGPTWGTPLARGTTLASPARRCHPRMGHWTTFDSPQGRISAWKAEPHGPPRGSLVVVQEIFGVNPHIRAVS